MAAPVADLRPSEVWPTMICGTCGQALEDSWDFVLAHSRSHKRDRL